MIPKIIHYCWFGKGEMNQLQKFCLNTWKSKLKDYEIKEWNEDNFDVNSIPFVKDAYDKKKWAFVSDYVRAYALNTEGGIYLDTDVEIRRSLDEFLELISFSGFETKGSPFTAVWGSVKNHKWTRLVLDYYDSQSKFTEITNTKIVSDLLVNEFNIDPDLDELQVGNMKEVVIFPSEFFCIDLPTSYAVHHFNGSWLSEPSEYKQYVNDRYHYLRISDKFKSHPDFK